MKPIFTVSDETNRIVGLFKELSVNGKMSFIEASKTLGFEIGSETGAYHSAKKIAARDYGIVIEGIRGFGFTRLNGSGMVKKGFRGQAGIRRAARRNAMIAEIAIRQNLERNEMVDVTQQLSIARLTEATNRQAVAKSNKAKQEKPEQHDQFDTRKAIRAATERRSA